MYRYETHCHTSPVSRCGRATVRETLEYYRDLGYDGVFITNHFLDGNVNIDKSRPFEERLNFFFSDYEAAKEMEAELGIRVFFGVEMAILGTDFLVYGLDKAWYSQHPEILDMRMQDRLKFLMECGALVIHAHPFREAAHIDCIRLYPRGIHGVETINASRIDFENHMAEVYAREYGFGSFAGSDNHDGPRQTHLAGMSAKTPIADEQDFIRRYHAGELELFVLDA